MAENLTTKPVCCPDCRNTFLQPFVCTTCGAQKLYDETVRSQAATIDRLTAEVAELRRVTKALVKAFRTPYPFAEQGRAAQDAWAVAREDSLLNAVAALENSRDA